MPKARKRKVRKYPYSGLKNRPPERPKLVPHTLVNLRRPKVNRKRYVEVVYFGYSIEIDKLIDKLAKECGGEHLGSGVLLMTSRRDIQAEFDDGSDAEDFARLVRMSKLIQPVLMQIRISDVSVETYKITRHKPGTKGKKQCRRRTSRGSKRSAPRRRTTSKGRRATGK